MSFLAKYTVYDDSNCQNIFLVNIVSGKYQVTGTSTDVVGAQKIDLTYSTSTMTLYKPSLIEKYNHEKVYGYNDWKVDVPKNISGRSYSQSDQPAANARFSLYRVENNKMYLGRIIGSKDGSSAEKRHVALDMKKAYHIIDK